MDPQPVDQISMKLRLHIFGTCFFFRRRLGRRIDRGEVPDDRERGHLSVCPRCRRYFETDRRLVERLRWEGMLPSPIPGGSVRDRVTAAIAEMPKPGRTRVLSGAPLTAAAVVALLVAGMVAWMTLRNPEPEGTPVAVVEEGEWLALEKILLGAGGDEADAYFQEIDRLAADGQATARFLLFPIPFDDDYE